MESITRIYCDRAVKEFLYAGKPVKDLCHLPQSVLYESMFVWSYSEAGKARKWDHSRELTLCNDWKQSNANESVRFATRRCVRELPEMTPGC
jgi:hypothetical protein